MNRKLLACLALAGALRRGRALAALPVYVKIAPPPPRGGGQGRGAGAGLFLGRRIPPLERHGLRLGAGPLGAAAAPGRRLGPRALEEHAPRLGLVERALAVIPAGTGSPGDRGRP